MYLALPQVPAWILGRLNRAGYEAYVVGGCVRDAVMGRTPHDWDICTNALPEEVVELFSDRQVVKTGLQHGTVTIVESGEGYEVTTFRTDGAYSDHRHPDQVTFVSRLGEDLARRDFTINAMAYHPELGLQDYYGGQADLKAGVIRCVGEPDRRFQEDGLRILRALRFAARFGFRLEEETGEAMHRNRALLDRIAAERIFVELKGFLVGQGVCPLLLEYRDLMEQILPPLAKMFDFPQQNPHHCYDVWTHTAHAVEAAPPEILLRLTLLFHDCGKPDCWSRDEAGIDHFYQHPRRSEELAAQMLARLRCDNRLKHQVLLQVRYHDQPVPVSERSGRRFLQALGEEGAFQSLAIHRADNLAQAPQFQTEKLARLDQSEALLRRLLAERACFGLKDLAVGGKDLLALGYQGPALGRELNRLLELVMDGACPNEHQALLDQIGPPAKVDRK